MLAANPMALVVTSCACLIVPSMQVVLNCTVWGKKQNWEDTRGIGIYWMILGQVNILKIQVFIILSIEPLRYMGLAMSMLKITFFMTISDMVYFSKTVATARSVDIPHACLPEAYAITPSDTEY